MPDTDRGEPSPTPLTQVLLEARAAGFLGPGPIALDLGHAAGFLTLARRLSTDGPGGTDGPARPRLLDLGSGGGLPGLVIAAEWPTATVVLLDANERRTDFLRRWVRPASVWGTGSRWSISGRRPAAGDPDYRATFEGVVVRSFGAPGVVAECSAPFLRLGGWLIVSEPPGTVKVGGARWPAEAVAQIGLATGEFAREGFGYQVLYQREPCPERYPRRNGVPAKSPLF